MSDWPNDWTWNAKGVEEDDVPSTTESFAALDEAGSDPSRGLIVGPSVTCPLPYLSIVVHDASGKPIVGATCKLAFPAGGGRTRKTDETGRAHFGNVNAAIEDLEVRVYEDPTRDDAPPTYRVEVVPREKQPPSSTEPEKEVREEPFYYVEADDSEGAPDDD